MGLGVLLQRVVQVVRRDERDAQLVPELDLPAEDRVLLGEAVVLQLDEVVVRLRRCRGTRRRHRGPAGPARAAAAAETSLRQAARHADDALGVLGHQLLVHAGPVVEALEMGGRDEAQEVAVSGLVAGQQREVVVLLLVLAGGAVEARARRHVGLDADDGLHARGPAGLEEAERAEHGAVVGDGHRRHPVTAGLGEDRRRRRVGGRRLDPRRAVQQRVLGVDVEVDEAGAAAQLL